MASVFLKRGKFWARLRGDKVPGKWSSVPTGEVDRDAAMRFALAAQKAIDRREVVVDVYTLRRWVATWMERRQDAVHDWKKDRGRLDNHILPVLGDVELVKLTTKHVADLVRDLRFTKKKAPRTVRNVYSVLAAVMRDAAVEGLIQTSPCILTESQLGPVVDKDREWRTGAHFDRHEAETLISSPAIPLDRRVVYALGLLAGLRPGEGAALRWRHWDPTALPLGKLTVALAYSTTNSKTKGTKTEAVRYVPVHPSLAALLAEWRGQWSAMFGHEPGDEDLIVPLPPDVNRRTRTGERFRGWDYTGRRWRDIDLPALGWRKRSVYDTKSTFITIAIEDGADVATLRDRVTHTKARKNAFDGYDRGSHWDRACEAVAKVGIRYLAPRLLPSGKMPESHAGLAPEEGIECSSAPAHARLCNTQDTESTEARRSSCDYGRALLLATMRPLQESDE